MKIRAGIFDLDGTLYFGDSLPREIARVAARYMGELKGVDPGSAWELIRATRKRKSVEEGVEASLSTACMTLGGDLHILHSRFSEEIDPELFLTADERVTSTLEALAAEFPLYIYTNNNISLTARIMETLGVTHLFNKVFTIENFWIPKPDPEVLSSIITDTGSAPSECLFAGDRYDIDLRLPEQMGAAVHLVRSVEDFLALNKFLSR